MRFLAAIALLLSYGLNVQAQTPIPPFTGEHLYVSGVGNAFAPLRADVERMQGNSRQDYYVVVVATTGSGEWATRDYIDRLYQQWTNDAQRRGIVLDPLRSVIILLAETNRQISLHCGSELQTKYGLVGTTINSELVDPLFLPRARAGNYLEGLRALLDGTEKWIQQRDADEKSRQEAVARRAAEIRRNAEATLSAVNELNALAQQELDASRKQGFQVERLAAQLAAEKPSLDEARSMLTGDPASALDRAHQTQQKLQSLVDQLRQLPAVATEVEQATRLLHDTVTNLSSRLEQTSRAGLPTHAAEARLARLREELTAASNLVKLDPMAAQETTSHLQAESRDIGRWLDELPQINQRYVAARKAAQASQQALAAEIKQAELAGTNASVAQQQLAERDQEISHANEQARTDLNAALHTVQTADDRLRTNLAALRTQHARHVWLTRTLPLTLLAVLAAGILGAAGLRWWWYQRRSRGTAAALNPFRLYTTELLDRLEALKKRHQLLPFSDEDYSESLTGETLAFYDQFEQVHNELRQQWLRLMEERQQIEVLLQSAQLWRANSLNEADRRLAAWDKDVTEQAYKRCDEHLRRLELAHEQARTSQQLLEGSLTKAQEQIESIRGHQLATSQYEHELGECRQRFDVAAKALQTDPIGAAQAVQELQQRTTALEQQCGQVIQQAQSAQQLDDKLRAAEQLAAQTRAEGFLLTEENSNPDPGLAAVHKLHDAARQALNASDAPTAEQHLQKGFQFVERATAGIHAQVEAKEFCQAHTLERERASDQLQPLLVRGRKDQQQLEQQFAPESWSDLAHNVETAAKSLERAAVLLQQVRAATANNVQRYLEARGNLEQAETQQQQAGDLLEQVRARVEQLEKLREASHAQLRTMGERAEEARQAIAQHEHLIGKAARELMAVAQRFREQAESGANQSRPNWPAIHAWMEQAVSNYGSAHQQAAEDVRCHQEFLSRLGVVRQEAQRVEQLLRSNTADRPRANQRYQTAATELGVLADHASAGMRDWQDLLRRLEQTAADLQKAEEWAREDLRVSQQAAAELREAEREIESASSFLGQGITADVSRAQAIYAEAQRQYLAQDYEQAIQLADQAEVVARQAAAEAHQRAEQRRQARELEQRRRAAATSASLPTIAMGRSGFPTSSHSSSTTSSSSHSSSSSQSWSSGSSQRSW